MRFTERVSRTDGLLVLCALFAVLLVLGALRSIGWSFSSVVDDPVPEWVAPSGYVLLFALCGLLLYAVRTPERSTYLLGASAALGVFPQIPKLSFFQDITHVALLLFLIAHWKTLLFRCNVRQMSDPRIKWYRVFFVICTLSVIANFLQRGDVWQLKVGMSGLVLQGLILMALYVCSISSERELASQMLRGLLDAALIGCLLGAATIVLLLIVPYSAGLKGDGQDTCWGLCYHDRLKLMFDGPGIASVYFVVVMNFGIYALSDRNELIAGWARGEWARRSLYFLVLMSPWLIVASGSRIGRIGLALSVLVGILSRPVRRVSLILLPPALVALGLAADFQSFPSSIRYAFALVSQNSDDIAAVEKLRLQDRFFQPEQRAYLMAAASLAFQEWPLLNKAIGMGYGVSGFSESTYPSPHNQLMKLVTEIGVLGFVAYLMFWFKSFSRIFSANMLHRCPAVWVIGVNLIAICGLSVVYEIGNRGFVLTFLLLAFSMQHYCDESKT